MIAVLVALVLLAAPPLFGLGGAWYARRKRPQATAPAASWNWGQTLGSALWYTAAFNLTFFIQELFLVLPKAFTPGLRPTLYHNNHSWQGSNPLAGLFQGTGALATLLSGLVCMLLLRRHAWRSSMTRLFLIWMAYSGLFMALPQVVIGAVSPRSDVGMAMDFLQLGTTARTAAALVALILIPVAAWPLTRDFLGTATERAQLASVDARMRYIFQVATLPALLAIPMIIQFRIPRELIEVAGVPVVVSVAGIAWIQASAWRAGAIISTDEPSESLAYPLAAALALLLVFQLVLRHGISFY